MKLNLIMALVLCLSSISGVVVAQKIVQCKSDGTGTIPECKRRDAQANQQLLSGHTSSNEEPAQGAKIPSSIDLSTLQLDELDRLSPDELQNLPRERQENLTRYRNLKKEAEEAKNAEIDALNNVKKMIVSEMLFSL